MLRSNGNPALFFKEGDIGGPNFYVADPRSFACGKGGGASVGEIQDSKYKTAAVYFRS